MPEVQAGGRVLQAKRRGRTVHRSAKALGFETESPLTARFPDLCRAIKAKRAAVQLARRSRVASALKAALSEDPPPPLEEVASRLGYASNISIHAWEPRLCKADRSTSRVCRTIQESVGELSEIHTEGESATVFARGTCAARHHPDYFVRHLPCGSSRDRRQDFQRQSRNRNLQSGCKSAAAGGIPARSNIILDDMIAGRRGTEHIRKRSVTAVQNAEDLGLDLRPRI